MSGSNRNNFPPTHNSTKSFVSAAPLFITIGPPCAGKTTWLKQMQQQQRIIDISLDDQPNVFIPVPLKLYLSSSEALINGTTSDGPLSDDLRELLKQSLYQKSVQERLLADDERELRLVLQRLSGGMSSQEFKEALVSTRKVDSLPHQEENQSEFQSTLLLESVESILESQTVVLPDNVDLFVVDALFQKNPDLNSTSPENLTGIERATLILRQTQRNISVCWANTNTKPWDYMAALEVAQEQRRPVHFCVFDVFEADGNNVPNGVSTVGSAPIFDLPNIGYRQLIERNILRLVRTGRYIPSKVIWDASKRVEKLVKDVVTQIRIYKSYSSEANSTQLYMPTKFDLDRQLARLAQFDLHKDRTVSKRKKGQWAKSKPAAQSQSPQDQYPYDFNRHQNGSQQYKRTSQMGSTTTTTTTTTTSWRSGDIRPLYGQWRSRSASSQNSSVQPESQGHWRTDSGHSSLPPKGGWRNHSTGSYRSNKQNRYSQHSRPGDDEDRDHKRSRQERGGHLNDGYQKG